MNKVTLYCLDNLKMCYVELSRIPKEDEFINVNNIYFKVEKIIHNYYGSHSDNSHMGTLDVFVSNVNKSELLQYSNRDDYQQEDNLFNL